MAIDSAAKRKSVLAISHYAMAPVVVPDGTLAKFDRQVIGYGYGGIASAAAEAATYITVSATMGVHRATGSLGTHRATATITA